MFNPQLTVFVCVADCGSFTKAAEELGYSQSTVTIQIQQLEKELGFPLFDRINKNVSLTPYGEKFTVYANEFLGLASKIQSLGKTAVSYTGTLKIGVLESLFVWKVADLLPVFHEQMPNIHVEIKSATGAALYRMLRQNELDIIYIMDNMIYHKDCLRTCVSPVSVRFVAQYGHRLGEREKIPLSEIAKEDLILAERDAIYRRELDFEAAKKDIEIIPMLEIDNLEVVLCLLKKGMGISFLPDFVVKDGIKEKKLTGLDVADGEINLWSQIVYHKNKFVTPQMQAFIKLMGSDQNI